MPLLNLKRLFSRGVLTQPLRKSPIVPVFLPGQEVWYRCALREGKQKMGVYTETLTEHVEGAQKIPQVQAIHWLTVRHADNTTTSEMILIESLKQRVNQKLAPCTVTPLSAPLPLHSAAAHH